MTANRTRVGILAVTLLAVLMSAGCSDSELLSSGNIVATMPTSGVNQTGNFECIRIDYGLITVRPTDGVCSSDSDDPGTPCGSDQDCTGGECDGGFAADSLEGKNVELLFEEVAYFTPQCPACSLNEASPRFCKSDDDCENPCVSADEHPAVCATASCCLLGFEIEPFGCETDADCERNLCVDSVDELPQSVLPEGRYVITTMNASDIRMFTPDFDRESTNCSGTVNLALEYDPPLNFTVGPDRLNEIRSVIDIQALEGLLGTDPNPQAGCDRLRDGYPEWFQIVSE